MKLIVIVLSCLVGWLLFEFLDKKLTGYELKKKNKEDIKHD